MANDEERKFSASAAKASRAARAPAIGYRLQDHHALCPDERRAKQPVFVQHRPETHSILLPAMRGACQVHEEHHNRAVASTWALSRA